MIQYYSLILDIIQYKGYMLTKLRSPISKIVDSHYFMPQCLVDVGQKITENGGSEMTSMEWFSNVGRTGKCYTKHSITSSYTAHV